MVPHPGNTGGVRRQDSIGSRDLASSDRPQEGESDWINCNACEGPEGVATGYHAGEEPVAETVADSGAFESEGFWRWYLTVVTEVGNNDLLTKIEGGV